MSMPPCDIDVPQPIIDRRPSVSLFRWGGSQKRNDAPTPTAGRQGLNIISNKHSTFIFNLVSIIFIKPIIIFNIISIYSHILHLITTHYWWRSEKISNTKPKPKPKRNPFDFSFSTEVISISFYTIWWPLFGFAIAFVLVWFFFVAVEF